MYAPCKMKMKMKTTMSESRSSRRKNSQPPPLKSILNERLNIMVVFELKADG